jgi:hypothetical protein
MMAKGDDVEERLIETVQNFVYHLTTTGGPKIIYHSPFTIYHLPFHPTFGGQKIIYGTYLLPELEANDVR